MTIAFLVLAVGFLAYSNGANDNFKGVASLFGSRTVGYRAALGWATVATFTGSVCSIFLAELLLKTFSGRGLIPDEFVASPNFLLAVALGAGATVMLATLTGFPISTTHSLTGAIVGSGLVAVGTQVNFGVLRQQFLLPCCSVRWSPSVWGLCSMPRSGLCACASASQKSGACASAPSSISCRSRSPLRC